MIDLKPYGAFIEYTVRPLVEESKSLLKECERLGVPLTETHINQLGKYLAKLYLISVISETIKVVITTGVVCLIAYALLV